MKVNFGWTKVEFRHFWLIFFTFYQRVTTKTRRPNEGQLKEAKGGYTFFWKGKDISERRIHGVGFAIKNSLIPKLSELPVGINERLMTLNLQLAKDQHATVISAYAPTLDATDEVKEDFYSKLDTILSTTPKRNKVILLGDFNARVGNNSSLWRGTIGKEGIGKMNSNGELLLTKCAEHNLLITNTLFRQKKRYKTSWQHPRSKHWHMIDYVIVKSQDRSDVLLTRAMTGADDCWTDHRLIRSKMNIKLRVSKQNQNKPTRKKFNTELLQNPITNANFQKCLLKKLPSQYPPSVDQHWSMLKTAITAACTETLGYQFKPHQDWFDENDREIQCLIEQKRLAGIAALNDPTSTAKHKKYRTLKSQVQRETRVLKNAWWVKKAKEIQHLADTNNTRAFFSATKAIYGPRTHGSVPIRSKDGTRILKNNDEISHRWREHYEDLLNRNPTTDDSVLNCIPQQPTEISLNAPPSREEIRGAIKAMKNNKAAGSDGIPAEIYKEGGPMIQYQIHQLVVKIWVFTALPPELRDAMIVNLFKKGDKATCGNYRGISLLSIAGKTITRILNNRLKSLAEKILPETQCGFRQSRGTTDMIFTARQLQEKSYEQNRPLYIAFIDLTKAFDSVNRPLLWKILAKIGCPDKFIRILRLFHDDMSATVLSNGILTEPFMVTSGVKQGCVIAPTLFSVFIATVLNLVKDKVPPGIEAVYRLDGGLFNLGRLRSKTKTKKFCLMELQYADDNAICASSESDLQTVMTAFHDAYTRLGLTVNIGKTQVLYQPPPRGPYHAPTIRIEGQALQNVDHFPYLGSYLSSNNLIDNEIQHRLSCASAAFGRMRTRVFDDHNIHVSTKIQVYDAIVMPTLLYGSETWTTYRRHLKALERFHQRCLRNILRIKWSDYRTNNSVLEEAKVTSVEARIIKSQLRWTGHLVRMDINRIPKQIFYSELANGKRTLGAPKKRYKEVLKSNLKKSSIDTENWESLAADRSAWRGAIHEGARHFEESQRQLAEEKRSSRKSRRNSPTRSSVMGTTCPHCSRTCASRIGLISHLRRH